MHDIMGSKMADEKKQVQVALEELDEHKATYNMKMITDYVSYEWDIKYMVAWMKREEEDGEEIQERPKKD
jgi:hypothetical protein